MKKSLLSLTLIIMFSFAESFATIPGGNIEKALQNSGLSSEANTDSEQQSITTKASLNEFISVLETAYRLGDKSKGYLLGGIYAQEHSLQDGNVPADTQKALFYFKDALKNGYGLSAWHIVLLQSIPSNSYFEALDLLEQGMNAKFTDAKSKATLSLMYGTIVLEHLNDNIRLVRKARDIIYPIAIKNNLASLDYILANLLNLNNESKEANSFLNSACNNPSAPQEIISACMGGSEIETKDEKTGQVIQKKEAECTKAFP